ARGRRRGRGLPVRGDRRTDLRLPPHRLLHPLRAAARGLGGGPPQGPARGAGGRGRDRPGGLTGAQGSSARAQTRSSGRTSSTTLAPLPGSGTTQLLPRSAAIVQSPTTSTSPPTVTTRHT